MRVELHRVTHDIGHLVVTSVVHALHGVQDAALHWLQSVLDMRHGTLQNHVGGIVEKPVLIHAAEMMHGCGIKTVYGFVVGMGLAIGSCSRRRTVGNAGVLIGCGVFGVLCFFVRGNIFCLVVHDC